MVRNFHFIINKKSQKEKRKYMRQFYNKGLVSINTGNFPLRGGYLFFERVGKVYSFFSYHSPEVSLG